MEDMELSVKDIATLREAVDGCGGPSYTQAVAILNRLAQPEPEQPDEVTVFTDRIVRALNAPLPMGDTRSQEDFVCPILSELIASKDAEIEKIIKRESETVDRLEKALSELAALRAENERLKINNAVLAQSQEPYQAAIGKMLCAAAERNPAEPDDILSIRAERALGNIRSPKASAAETTPEVVVTQEGATSAQIYADYHCEDTTWKVECAERLAAEFDRVRTEAEARGRRDALEKLGDLADERWAGTREGAALRGLLIELKRLMTGGK